MAQEIVQYLTDHPRLFFGAVAVAVVLAGIGLWYVIAHHLQVVLLTILCLGGIVSGAVVVYRGVTASMTELKFIGAFLVLAFPVIFLQALRLLHAEPPEPKPADKPSRKAAAGV